MYPFLMLKPRSIKRSLKTVWIKMKIKLFKFYHQSFISAVFLIYLSGYEFSYVCVLVLFYSFLLKNRWSLTKFYSFTRNRIRFCFFSEWRSWENCKMAWKKLLCDSPSSQLNNRKHTSTLQIPHWSIKRSPVILFSVCAVYVFEKYLEGW